MVSSEEEFLRAMENPYIEYEKVNVVRPAIINKLGLAARKYKDSNQMNKLLNSFFASIKNEASIFKAEEKNLFKKFTHFRTSIAGKKLCPIEQYPYNKHPLKPTNAHYTAKELIEKITPETAPHFFHRETPLTTAEVDEVECSTHQPSQLRKVSSDRKISSISSYPGSHAMKMTEKHIRKSGIARDAQRRFDVKKRRQTGEAVLVSDKTKRKSHGEIRKFSLRRSRNSSTRQWISKNMLSSVKSMISSPFTVGLGGADVENHNETLKKPTLQKTCSSASKFSGSPKTKQYTAGYPDKKSVSNWNEFGLGRKDSYTVNHTPAISCKSI